MAVDNYIVEGSNWKCRVALERNSDQDAEYRLVEAATRCIEHLFGGGTPNSEVDVIELTDMNGTDFFTMEDVDEDSIPDPAFGLLTKVYKLKDAKKEQNHYVVRTRTLMENASAYDALKLAHGLENMLQQQQPEFFKTVERIMQDHLVLKYGDLKEL